MQKRLTGVEIWILLWCLMAVLHGCEKIIAIELPEDKLTPEVVFSDDIKARASVDGLYKTIMQNKQSILNGGESVYTGLSSDELIRVGTKNDEEQFSNNELTAANPIITNNFWKRAYQYINHTNACIDGLKNATHLNGTLKNTLMGESKFMRAFCYWYLVNLFSNVPLATSPDADVNRVLPRSPDSLVYKLILQDLSDAWELLPDNAPNTLPGKWVAAAMLARFYRYRESWAQAENFATMVIESGRFQLADSLDSVFTATSKEVIFQLIPTPPNNSSSEGLTFIPASGLPTYIIRDNLLSAFESGDGRKISWVKTVFINGVSYSYPYKYKIKAGKQPAAENNVMFRMAEVYLLRAEARAHQRKITAAVDDVNIIRIRAGLQPLQAIDSAAEVLDAVNNEKRIELFCEWGSRWISLKQTNRVNEVLQPVKRPYWQSTDQLYPVPLSELQLNPNLDQNPGY